jgi:predicted tellurium resistance membrane protein TerC
LAELLLYGICHRLGDAVVIAVLTDPNTWGAFAALSALEIVLGIDNIVFISILVSRCGPEQALRARQIGLSLAFVFRVVMLFGLTWLMRLTFPLFSLFGVGISWRDIILIGGGLFLIAKSTHEVHKEVEPGGKGTDSSKHGTPTSFVVIVVQLIAVDLVLSLDSIITAIGMVDQIEIMIAAIILAMVVMYLASGPVSAFVAKHPTIKMLALAFLMLIGVALLADGFDFHIPRGYIYFAMAFAGGVEALNILARRNRRPSPP